jgi:hypothetical protein
MYENSILEPRAHRLLAQHHVDAEVLADVAQKVEIGVAVEPIVVVDHQRVGHQARDL